MLWISEASLTEMSKEAERAYPLETGGILAGYVANCGDIVLAGVSGPGPNATHDQFRFTPDHDWQCLFLDKLYRDSSGISVYLGDWHTHPNGRPHMSRLDKKTLNTIAKSSEARCPSPLMMIGSGELSKWDWLAHQYVLAGLFGWPVFSRKLQVNIFS
ncbi:Mov34/MPN/PAD-1 family protein [Marinobacter sp.]|uniref:Mov34/MPN/PAD-1 family protein n=1 Tax=Marinobacter sp. TaxID=50741 RepID=UPI002356B390|nr:Mov34/MPN/PAD-1 family protein [Marinobacter sp.]